MWKRALLTCVALFCASQALFLVRIQQPPAFSFDELFYVPAARAFVSWTGNPNPQHPPLAKYLIALGIGVAGDHPLGWRIMASLFGGLTVAGMYCWALAIFRRQRTAVWVALLALLNQLLFVLARTGMLEIFMVAFLVWGMAAFCAAWTGDPEARRAPRLLLFAGAMFGLATACKWLGIVAWGTALGAVALAKILVKHAGTAQPQRTQESPKEGREHWLAPRLPGLGAGTILLALLVVPLAAYLATFVALLWLPGADASVGGLWRMQVRIWEERSYMGSPVQMSPWWQWPLHTAPLAFYYQREGTDAARAVFLLGNPAVLWTGLAAALVCLWDWVRSGSRQAFLVLLWFGALWLSWAVLPRRGTFFYYYFPAALALTLALGYCVERWPDRRLLGVRWYWLLAAAAAVVFALQYPVSTAMRVPIERLPR